MTHFMTKRYQRLNDDLKARILSAICEQRVTQEEIADSVGLSQSTVSRYLTYGGDLMWPAALTPALDTPRLKSIAVEIVRFQAEGLGYSLVSLPSNLALDGKISDEVLSIVTYLGRLSETVQDHPERVPELRKQVNHIDEVLVRLRGELALMESRR